LTSSTKYGASQQRRRKFGNKPTGGFDSKKEMNRYYTLEMMQRAGEISDLQTQVKFLFPLRSEANRQLHYVADFTYTENGKRVVEDVKSVATRKLAVFTYKVALMKHFHNIELRIT